VKTRIRSDVFLLVLTLAICCVFYPAVLYAIGKVLFPTAAAGSLIDDQGNDATAGGRGSRLIAQPFTNDEYFSPRPSAATYNAAAAGGSNYGANNPKLRDRVAQQLGPLVVYKAGSKSAASGRTPQQDIEAWFAAKPDRAADWASDSSVGPANWAKTDLTRRQVRAAREVRRAVGEGPPGCDLRLEESQPGQDRTTRSRKTWSGRSSRASRKFIRANFRAWSKRKRPTGRPRRRSNRWRPIRQFTRTSSTSG